MTTHIFLFSLHQAFTMTEEEHNSLVESVQRTEVRKGSQHGFSNKFALRDPWCLFVVIRSRISARPFVSSVTEMCHFHFRCNTNNFPNTHVQYLNHCLNLLAACILSDGYRKRSQGDYRKRRQRWVLALLGPIRRNTRSLLMVILVSWSIGWSTNFLVLNSHDFGESLLWCPHWVKSFDFM